MKTINGSTKKIKIILHTARKTTDRETKRSAALKKNSAKEK